MRHYKFNIATILVICFFNSCQQKREILDTNIINNIFLEVVDTLAYKYYTLRPASNDSSPKKVFKNIPITVYDVLYDIHKWDKSILADLDISSIVGSDKYKKLYHSTLSDTASYTLEITEIKKAGKYKLIVNHNPDIQKEGDVAGHVKFSRVLYNNDVGLLVATIQDNIKSGIVKLLYLKKTNNNWSVIRETILEIW